ncbi:hypothetical protein Trydic_g1278 [Trypoxylus dichotomus]
MKSTKEVVDKLKHQQLIFGNLKQIVFDRATAFTSQDFEEYCENENMRDLITNTGVPRGNGIITRSLLVKRLTGESLDAVNYMKPSKQYTEDLEIDLPEPDEDQEGRVVGTESAENYSMRQ